MNKMIAITINPGAVTAAARVIVFGKAWPIIPPPAATKDEEERAEQLGEQPPPLLLRVLEVFDGINYRGLEPILDEFLRVLL